MGTIYRGGKVHELDYIVDILSRRGVSCEYQQDAMYGPGVYLMKCYTVSGVGYNEIIHISDVRGGDLGQIADSIWRKLAEHSMHRGGRQVTVNIKPTILYNILRTLLPLLLSQ